MQSFLRYICQILSPFTSDKYMNTLDCIFVIVVTSLAVIGFILNALLFYLIIFRSPPTLSPYRIFLGNTSLTQLLMTISILLSQPRVISLKSYTVVIYMGPVQEFGIWVTYMSYVFVLHLSLNSFISLMLSMVYRYNSVKLKRFTSLKSFLICLMGYLFCFSLWASCSAISVSADQDINEGILNGTVPDFRSYKMVISTNIRQAPLMVLVFMVSIGLLPIYFIMYWCRFKIYQALKYSTSIHSTSTRVNVRRLVKALTIQSIIPVVSIFPASILYSMSQLDMIQTALYSYFIVPCITIITIVDPLVTIQCVLPYRRFIMKLCNIPVGEITTSYDRSVDRMSKFSKKTYQHSKI